MAEQEELEPGSSGATGPDGATGLDNEPEPETIVPVYKRENIPTGKVDQVMWYAFRGKTRKELSKPPYNQKPGTVRVGFTRLAGLEPEWIEAQEKQEVGGEGEGEGAVKHGKQLVATTQKTPQICSKGSPPEAIIESIHIPQVDGQSQGFEMGMKFGMTQLVLAVRIMQELAGVAQSQVKPLIDLVRTVREGEQAAFKGGADEGALKAAQAMGGTIMPMMSEMQTTIANLNKGSESNPMQSMMIRTMEPLIKNMMGGLMPGMGAGTQAQEPEGWTRKQE